MGLDGTYLERLGRYMKQVFVDHDLGSSYYTGVSVKEQIKARLPFTLRIAGISILVAACIGIPLGVLAATHHYTWIDNLVHICPGHTAFQLQRLHGRLLRGTSGSIYSRH